jgi:pSer/pThr/pTyr-binding forkhead associated (FHA) protein
MPLKVRFRHASSQRVLDLPDRGLSKPLIIGRGDDVDLRLPFDVVAPQHAALYLKDGVWVIQGISGVVTLGGRALNGPARLQSGDVIALGAEPSAPTLEIEPKEAAPAGALEAKAARPQPAPAPAPAPVRLTPNIPQSEPDSENPATVSAATEGYAPAEGGDIIEWDPQALVPDTSHFYVPAGRKTSLAAILLAVIFGGGLVVAVGVFAYRKTRQPAVIIVRQDTAPAQTPIPANQHKPLFDVNGDQQSTRTISPKDAASAPPGAMAPTGSGKRLALASTPSADRSISAADHASPKITPADADSDSAPRPAVKEEVPPDPNDTEWNDIRGAHFNVRHQGVAILKYDEYRREHPGKFTDLLDRYSDEAVNWLYWQRVAQLWSRQDDQTAELRQKTRDIQNQPPGEFHEKLVREQAELQARADQTRQLLTEEMGYHGDVPPDLESPRTLKQLAESRDPAKFAAFTRRVLRYVRNNHGGVWWDGE